MMLRLAQFSLILTIALSPLYIIRGFLLVPGIDFYLPYTFLEFLILMSGVLTALASFNKKFTYNAFRTSLDVFIGIFFLAALLAVATSYDFIGGLGIFKAYIIEPILFYYCLVFMARQKGYSFIVWGLIGAACWLSLLGILQKFAGVFIFAPIEYSQNRITGVYNSANSLALFLGPLIILTFFRFFSLPYKNKAKYLYLILFGIFLFVLYFTRSRGGILSLIGAMSVFTFAVVTIKSKLIRKFWLVAPILVGGCLIGFFVYLYHNYDFFQIDYSRPYTAGDTLQIRYFIWGGTVNLLKEHFIFGAGLNGFKTLYSNQYRPVQYQEQFQYPHNILLTFWTEMGLFGLFAFLLLVVTLYGLLIRNLIKSQAPVLGAALIAILSYWMLHGMVDVPYFKNDLSLEFWTIVALIESWRIKKVNT
jgi:O-antigen ligase